MSEKGSEVYTHLACSEVEVAGHREYEGTVGEQLDVASVEPACNWTRTCCTCMQFGLLRSRLGFAKVGAAVLCVGCAGKMV